MEARVSTALCTSSGREMYSPEILSMSSPYMPKWTPLLVRTPCSMFMRLDARSATPMPWAFISPRML